MVVAERRGPTPTRKLTGSRDSFTLAPIISASGVVASLLVVTPKTKGLKHWHMGDPDPSMVPVDIDSLFPRCRFATSRNSHIDKEMVTDYLLHDGVAAIRAAVMSGGGSDDDWAVLLIDNAGPHRIDPARLVPIFQKRKIQLVYLPPNTTSILQPLDVGVFGRLEQERNLL